jgi:3-oxoadipate enol-lactonase
MQKELWLTQRSLARRFTLIAYDNRGWGLSSRPRGPYTVGQLAEDAVGLLDHLGILRAHLFGVSLGGMIAQEVALRWPERVDRLVLASTAGRAIHTFPPAFHGRAIEAWWDLRGLVAQASAYLGFDGLERARAIRAPTLVVAGSRDKTLPAEHGRELAERIPGARFLVMRGSHWLVWEGGPMLAAEVGRFLSEPAKATGDGRVP